MRNSIQRQLILNVVKKMHSHPAVDDIYQEIQKEHPSISRSTVYRNLHQLVESGAINQVFIPNDPERFDDYLKRHYHFLCKLCGSIHDVDLEYLSEINEAAQRAYGFQVDEHDIIFKGICKVCQEGLKT